MTKGINGHQVSKTENMKMYVIVRGDISMSPGKAAAQVGHGYKLLTRDLMRSYPELESQYFKDDDPGANVTLYAPDLAQLLQCWNNCVHLDVPKVLFEDSGHIHLPDFTGQPIVTVMAIGPICKEDLPESVQKLSLY